MVVVVMINMMDIHRISWGLHLTGETLLNMAPKYKIMDLIISGEYLIYCRAFTFNVFSPLIM